MCSSSRWFFTQQGRKLSCLIQPQSHQVHSLLQRPPLWVYIFKMGSAAVREGVPPQCSEAPQRGCRQFGSSGDGYDAQEPCTLWYWLAEGWLWFLCAVDRLSPVTLVRETFLSIKQSSTNKQTDDIALNTTLFSFWKIDLLILPYPRMALGQFLRWLLSLSGLFLNSPFKTDMVPMANSSLWWHSMRCDTALIPEKYCLPLPASHPCLNTSLHTCTNFSKNWLFTLQLTRKCCLWKAVPSRQWWGLWVGCLQLSACLWWCLRDAGNLRALSAYHARDGHRRFLSWRLLLPSVQRGYFIWLFVCLLMERGKKSGVPLAVFPW